MGHTDIKTALRGASSILRGATEKATTTLASHGFEPGCLVENEQGVYRITYISLARYIKTNPKEPHEFSPSIYGVKRLRNGKFGDYVHYVGDPTFEHEEICFVRPYVERKAA
ncbi:hypothetical protein [Thalassospira povalilytica]|uniref:hypothetical protein n=1 Tax=Thalassospira povalilytica TaxID=732237 RepID=UPI003AA854EC